MRHPPPPSVPRVPYTAASLDAKKLAALQQQQQQRQRRRGNTCFSDISGPELSLFFFFLFQAKPTSCERGGNMSSPALKALRGMTWETSWGGRLEAAGAKSLAGCDSGRRMTRLVGVGGAWSERERGEINI